jgi:AcrR family transcriptional regulator
MNVHPVATTTSTALPDAGDKRDRILDAALALFAERGFHGTPVPLVAERANVGAGTIYRYFASKEALVNALYRRWKLAFIDCVSVDFPIEKTTRAQWSHVFRRAVEFAQKNPQAFDFLELHHHAPYLDDESRALENRVLTIAQTILGASRLLKATRDEDSALLISLVWGGLIQMIRFTRQGMLEITPQVLDRFENLTWEALRA